MSQFELKPCPFCGETNQNVFPPTCKEVDVYNPNDRAFPIVRCFGCYTDVAGKDWDASSKTAVERWNGRVESNQALITKLREALEWTRRNYASGPTAEINRVIDAALALAKSESQP